ncbi:MAG: PAS domain-containing sensor histidine kinase [Pseudomonadota bacterium]
MSLMVQTDGDARRGQRGGSAPREGTAAPADVGSLGRFGPLFAVSGLTSLALLAAMVSTGLAAGYAALSCVLLFGLTCYWLVLRGQFANAALVATAALTVHLAWMTAQTGGMLSPFILLFVIAPIEASLTHDTVTARRTYLLTLACLLFGAVGSFAVETFVPVSEGTMFMLLAGGCLYGVLLALRAVRASTLRDVQARATHRAIDQFHDITHDMFMIVGRDGGVRQVFGAVEAILGCPSTDLSGDGFLNRLHVADRPLVLSRLDDVEAMGTRDTVEARMRVGPCDGPQQFLWTEIDLSAVTNAEGATEIYALVRDIHRTKDHEAELTLAREKAEASDAAKGRFLASMSHELRTPLNAIIGFADILEEEVFGALANEQQREYVGLIRESGGHLLQLVNDLLDMSKLDAGHFQIVAEPFTLRTVVDRCAKLLQGQIDKAELTLKLDVPERLPELVGDQRAVRQILINLLSNACKFTEALGTITLRVRQDRDQMIISVIDDGIGIAPQDVKRLGEPFFQANSAYDRNHQGTGLGLSVVKGLCELHDGRLTISSVQGEGTTVAVYLPLSGPKAPSVDAADGAPAEKANTVVFAKLEKERALGRSVDDVINDENAGEADNQLQERKRAHG